MLLTGFGRIFKTRVEQWTSVAEFAGCDGGVFAQRFVWDVFREKEFGCASARDVLGVVEFDEEVVELVSVVEHTVKTNK